MGIKELLFTQLAFETGLATIVTHKNRTFSYKLSKKDASPTYAEYTGNKTILKRLRSV